MDAIPLSLVANATSEALSDDISVAKLLLTLFLVFLNGFFVAAEFAIVKVRTSQIQVQQNISSSNTKAAMKIVNNLDSYLAATQLGITLASLGLGWVGESSLTPVILKSFDLFGLTGAYWDTLARNISFPIAFVIITILHIVFGELAPKSLAIQFPTKTTFAVAWPLRIFYAVFKPVIYVMNGFANILLRIIGVKPIHGSDIHSEEELRMIITESQAGGAIEETERDLIQNVFDFDDRRVTNVFTIKKNVSIIDVLTPVKEVIRYTLSEGYSRYPVYEDNTENIIGVLHTKDLFRAYAQKGEGFEIKSILREPLFVSETSLIKNLLKTFQQKHIQVAIVTDEIGDFIGLVTLEDILEELVGEIQDEYDNEEPIVSEKEVGVFIVDSHNTITDINRFLPYSFEESEHYETLAGLIAEICTDEYELKEGDIVDLEYYTGRILKMYRNSVELIELKVKDKNEKEELN
ncbi:hemolysin family protein [Flavobacterium agricola]|uniref:Hemolysin family protein n=1 Tax=Flavobacterium agricola TaxID=2870839 RepID=A0ABY6M050_9FLAO|nr:hemolysin family protein [Flavobacterium agricola]UYW01927.1 hemolysin family protein [Flavobacterium agricola]